MRRHLTVLALVLPLISGCTHAIVPTSAETERPMSAPGEQFKTATGAVSTNLLTRPTPTVSLPWAVWTNYVAHTNGRSIDMFTTNIYVGIGSPRILWWNTNNLIYGAEGFTAFTTESGFAGIYPGTVQGTLLTKRHAIFRGHGWTEGNSGIIRTNVTKSWFLTSSNTPVEVTSAAVLGRLESSNGMSYDFAIVIFDADVPDSITPVGVIMQTNFLSKYTQATNTTQRISIQQCQHYKSTALDGTATFSHNTWVGGDSGAANLLPLPSTQGRPFKLAYVSGRSTSGVTPLMLAEIDRLTVWAGLKTNDYRPTIIDLSDYY
jgi:hypothetical protein